MNTFFAVTVLLGNLCNPIYIYPVSWRLLRNRDILNYNNVARPYPAWIWRRDITLQVHKHLYSMQSKCSSRRIWQTYWCFCIEKCMDKCQIYEFAVIREQTGQNVLIVTWFSQQNKQKKPTVLSVFFWRAQKGFCHSYWD